MARKKRTFMDKIAKGTGPRGEKCPKCGEILQAVKIVRPYKTDKGSWRYLEEMVRVCKCNQKELLVDKPIS
ncbi:hypothetical protein DRQ33_03360 [bacterium]|nr:MAG: hypothetical protein DRQ33_03360 [bacterium]